MRYSNTSDRPLDFELRGKRYQVCVGGTCDIPTALAYAVKSRGLPLAPDMTEEDERDLPELPPEWQGDELPPIGTMARLWAIRASEARAEADAERRRAEDLDERLTTADAVAEQLRADLAAVCRERDEALGLLEEAGARPAPDATAASPEGPKELAPPVEGNGRRKK